MTTYASHHREMDRQDWEIANLQAAPSMCETKTTIRGTYEDACNEARRLFRATGRRSSVCAGGASYWFHVLETGEIDLNRRAPIARAPDDTFIDARGNVRRILKYGEDGPNGARSYWLAEAR